MAISVIKASVAPEERLTVSNLCGNVEVIEVSSSSLAAARRKGFLASKGEYVCYDINWLEGNEKAMENTPDVIVSTADKSKTTADSLLAEAVVSPSGDFLQGLVFHRRLYGESGAWCPPEISAGEDKVLAVALLSHAETVVVIPPARIIGKKETVIADEDLDSLVDAVGEIEAYLRRHGKYDACRRNLDRCKMRLKSRYISLRGMKKAKGLFKETDPSVAEGVGIGPLTRIKLLLSRF